MTGPRDIRRALKERMDGPYTVEVATGPIEYTEMGRGCDRYRFDVTVLAGPAGDEESLDRLDALIAPDGTKTRLETDRTLDGLTSDLEVTSCTGVQLHRRGEHGELVLAGATWRVDVVVT